MNVFICSSLRAQQSNLEKWIVTSYADGIRLAMATKLCALCDSVVKN